MAGVEYAEQHELDDDERLRLQALCRGRLRELADSFESTAPWWRRDHAVDRWEVAPRGYHSTWLPSLIEQVRIAATGRRHASGSSGTYESKPPAQIEAIDTEQHITAEAVRFVESKLHHATHGLVEEDLRLIERRVPTLVDEDLRELVGLARSWWTSARIMSGLEDPPMTPHVRCPLCEKQDSIRCRLDASDSMSIAWCSNCREAWDEDNLGLLIASIEESDERGPRPTSKPAPRYEYVFVGNATQARRWAHANGIDARLVYPASEGPEALHGVRGPMRLVLPADRSKGYADSLEAMAAVVNLVRDTNLRMESEQ